MTGSPAWGTPRAWSIRPRPSAQPPLFTYDFVALCLVTLFGFANIAMFYSFHLYLARLGLDQDRRGPLLALLSYLLAREACSLALVRLFHGLGFVLLVSALTTLLTGVMPPERSGQGFGVFTVATLLPIALVPPLFEALLRVLGNAALLLLPVGRRLARRAPQKHPESGRSNTLAGLRLPGVTLLLLASLFTHCAITPVTFFVKSLALRLGLADPDLVFSVSMGATIVMRLVGGRLFDRLPKLPLLTLGLAGLAISLALFGAAANGAQPLVLAGCLGLSLGLVLPLLNASLFLATPPHLRGVVLNRSLFTMDAGTALGPLLGGALLARGLELGEVYRLCGGLAGGALVWVLLSARRKGTA